MIWAKRQVAGIEYIPYFNRLERLLMSNAKQYREFLMVSTKADEYDLSDFYVGLPNETFMDAFDGFHIVDEGSVPTVVDTLHIGDAVAFDRRFLFRHNLRRRA
jgi:hypothetical protein